MLSTREHFDLDCSLAGRTLLAQGSGPLAHGFLKVFLKGVRIGGAGTVRSTDANMTLPFNLRVLRSSEVISSRKMQHCIKAPKLEAVALDCSSPNITLELRCCESLQPYLIVPRSSRSWELLPPENCLQRQNSEIGGLEALASASGLRAAASEPEIMVAKNAWASLLQSFCLLLASGRRAGA